MKKEYLVDFFRQLARIGHDLPRLRDYLGRFLALNGIRGGGVDFFRDEAGNLILNIPAAPGYENRDPLGLCAHLDLVANPGDTEESIEVYQGSDGHLHSAGETILGADDLAGVVAVVFAAIEVTQSNGRNHGPIDLLFTVGEETGLTGSRGLDADLVRARRFLIIDGEKPEVIWREFEGKSKWRLVFHGRAAHTGLNPAEGICALELGLETLLSFYGDFANGDIVWEDAEASRYVRCAISGLWAGLPGATNVIPGRAEAEIELRGTAPLEVFGQVIEALWPVPPHDGQPPYWERECFAEYAGASLPPEDPLVQRIAAAVRAEGLDPRIESAPGSTDANGLAQHGIEAVAIGCGQRQPHSIDEHLVIDEMVAAAEIAARFLRAT